MVKLGMKLLKILKGNEKNECCSESGDSRELYREKANCLDFIGGENNSNYI